MSDERPVFVDTNILVYAFDESDTERQQRAERALAPLFLQDRIRLSTQVLQEFYVTMTRKVRAAWKPGEALEVLDDLAAWPLLVVNYELIRESVLLSEESRISFWDSLVVNSAARSGADTLFTEDLNDGQVVRGIRVSNPLLG
jgi:predicted nucleic acid-binding protein